MYLFKETVGMNRLNIHVWFSQFDSTEQFNYDVVQAEGVRVNLVCVGYNT